MVQIETSQMDVGHMKMSWVGAVLCVQGAEEEKLFNGMFIAQTQLLPALGKNRPPPSALAEN